MQTFLWLRQIIRDDLSLVRKGKVKDIYKLDDGNLMFNFTDRISAFDVSFSNPIPRKGEVLCRFAEFWFKTLEIPNHMVKVIHPDKMIVKPMKMIPLECIVRGYYYGSIVERFNAGKPTPLKHLDQPVLASRLESPIFDPTSKSEEHDQPITREEAYSKLNIDGGLFDSLSVTSIKLYESMRKIVTKAGFIIADVKFEFGLNANGEWVLCDSLGPDEFRLWKTNDYVPGKIQESYDKQILRDWLIQSGFKAQVDSFAASGQKPNPPDIPADLIQKLSLRYISAYEQITGLKV